MLRIPRSLQLTTEVVVLAYRLRLPWFSKKNFKTRQGGGKVGCRAMLLDDSPLLFSRCIQLFRDGSPPTNALIFVKKKTSANQTAHVNAMFISPSRNEVSHLFGEWMSWRVLVGPSKTPVWDKTDTWVFGFLLRTILSNIFQGAEFWDVPKCVCGLLNRFSFFRNFPEICTCSNTYRFKACHLEVSSLKSKPCSGFSDEILLRGWSFLISQTSMMWLPNK